MQESNKIS